MGSEVYATGFNHLLVMAGLRSLDFMMARPNDDRSLVDVYMLPVLN